MIPIVSIVGKTNSGKTTLIEKIIPELKKRGYKVGIIKHDVHKFEIDHEGKDTYRMTEAGADTVVISSREKMAMIKKVRYEQSIDEIMKYFLCDVDIIITEGYKSENKPKIEVIEKEGDAQFLCKKDDLLAVVSDREVENGVICFKPSEIIKITDFIEKKLLKKEVAAK